MRNAITLSNPISVSLMLEVAETLRMNQNRDLGNFCVRPQADDQISLCAYYPGNGHLVGIYVVIFNYSNDDGVASAVADFARDLNTLFGLK